MFEALAIFERFFWGYVGFSLVILLGMYFTFKTRFFQLRALPSVFRTFYRFLRQGNTQKGAVHPLKAFFASVGGMVGIGNIVGIVTAIQMGGPGALFWVWCAAFFGMLIKYSEVYLGIKYRQKNQEGRYDGGPMFFLPKAFPSIGKALATLAAVLLCVYGVEIYQFSVVTHTIESNWGGNHTLIVLALLGVVLFAGIGGVQRVGKICTAISPFFMVLYITLALIVIGKNIVFLPAIFQSVFSAAFTGQAALGGFLGSSLLLTLQQGTARAAYSADLGIGYDSIIHSESSTTFPQRQARLAILGVCLDNFVCTLSILLVLITGLWHSDAPIPASMLVQTALSHYFPGMHLFVPTFLMILGYCTMIAYFCVGIKCAQFLSRKWGKRIYVIYGGSLFLFFSFFDQSNAMIVMSICGSLLLTANLSALWRLRKEIDFGPLPEDDALLLPQNPSSRYSDA